MKIIYIYISFLLFPVSLMAQQQPQKIVIEVLDKSSGKHIEDATLADKVAGRFIVADKGKFEIYLNKKMLADTLFIDAQGYEKTKIVLSTLLREKKIRLTKQQAPVLASTNLSKSEHLNDYENTEVQHWLGFPMGNKPFAYLQVGQIFENATAGAQLKRIRLNQLYFDVPQNIIYDDGSMDVGGFTYADKGNPTIFEQADNKDFMHTYLASYIQQNKFRPRIYQLDEHRQPTLELCTDPILIDREPPVENMHIDLSKYKILLPQGDFMVAVEWIPTNKNFNYVIWTKWIYDMGQALRPFIGVNSKKGDRLNVMGLDYGGNWSPFDYLSPYYTDLAMECEIE